MMIIIETKEFVTPEFKEAVAPLPGQRLFIRFNRLRVIVSDAVMDDGNMWRHVSMSHKNKLPSYKEMCLVKKIFIGDDRKAIQVFPAKSEHVNIHPYCLHLYCNMSHDNIPDFTMGSGMI